MKDKFLLIIFVILTGFLLVFGQPASQKLSNFFIFGKNSAAKSSNNLILENKSLKAEVAELQNFKNQLPYFPADYLPAFVYSRYPFNFKNEILVNIGADNGIKAGAPAVITASASSTPILVGKVEEVFPHSSLIRTIFDGRFQLAVRIGSSGADALLRGGASPTLTLIPKNSDIADGDAVYSAASDFPYGLAVGTVRNAAFSGDQLFKKADLEAGYNPNALQSVLVIKNP